MADLLTVLLPAIAYGIVGIIWAVRLEGKVKSMKELFNMFLENNKEKDKMIKESIDKLFECQRKIETIVNKMEGKLNT